MQDPSASVGSGRDTSGRFAKGNPGGPGNPYARRVAALRQALFEAVSPDDLREIVTRLVEQAKSGDVNAAKEVILRTLGRPTEADLLERLEQLESYLTQ